MKTAPKVRTTAIVALVLAFLAGCGGNITPQKVNDALPNLADVEANSPSNPPSHNDPTGAAPTPFITPKGPGQPVSGGAAPTIPVGRSSTGTPAPQPGTPANDPDPAPPAGELPDDAPKKISARHVLIQWMGSDKSGGSVVRTKDQALGVARAVWKRAKAGEDMARLAVEYSDEPNAGARGGSLGRFGRGQMVPAFENAAFRLKVGEISDIIETGFGYHIIQRTE